MCCVWNKCEILLSVSLFRLVQNNRPREREGGQCLKMSQQVNPLTCLTFQTAISWNCILFVLLLLSNECVLRSASSAERQQVLGALERLQAKLLQREEWTHSETMGNLRETLQSPLFSHILTLQHSINQLRSQVTHPSSTAYHTSETHWSYGPHIHLSLSQVVTILPKSLRP